MTTGRRDEEGRPLPEDLLCVARRAEKAHEGELTVYLGYSPGVEKLTPCCKMHSSG